MIARILRWSWVVAIVVTIGAARLSIHWFAAAIGPLAAALAALLAIALLHPLAIAFNFAISRIFGDPVPPSHRLTWWQAVKTYDAEIDASMRGLWFATPFLAHRPAPRPRDGVALRPLPILFIHGYFCNRAIWRSFLREAASRGHVCEAVTLPNPFASIDLQVPTVHRAIDELLAAAKAAGSSATRVVLVGHSMGGLVARATLQQVDASRIAHVITLGTPHRGTGAARLSSVPSVVQMRGGSPWLAALDAAEATRGRGLDRVHMTTVFSYHDDIVFPQTTGGLDGTRQVAIGGCGHVALVYDRRVRRIVFDRIDALESPVRDRQDPAEGRAS